MNAVIDEYIENDYQGQDWKNKGLGLTLEKTLFMKAIIGLVMLLWTAVPMGYSQDTSLTVTVEMKDCGAELLLFEFNGIGLAQTFKATQLDTSGVYAFRIPHSGHRFYYLGEYAAKSRLLILGEEKEVTIKGTCSNVQGLQFVNSPVNLAYDQLRMEMNRLQQENNGLSRSYTTASDAEKVAIKDKLLVLDQKKLDLLEKMKNVAPILYGVAALNTYLSFVNHQEGYPDEVAYFADRYFQFADLSQPEFEQSPWVYETFKNYTSTLSRVNLDPAVQKNYLDKVIAGVPSGGSAHLFALMGVINALQTQKQGNFAIYAKQFIEVYGNAYPELAAAYQKSVDASAAFTIGGEAPNFSQETPEGEQLSLRDLRGKVLLIDFWASWCGPCRRENPNVVRMYQKYKDQGFEILGVSLDSNRDRWLGAIAADGLTWYQVSDLKGWQNAVAKQYGVSAIPHTVLLDAEGRIIARNLRGATLERKLEELFGQ